MTLRHGPGAREREAERRAGLDAEYVTRFAQRIRELFPGCPSDRAERIAVHACQKYSGRVGRAAPPSVSTKKPFNSRSPRTSATRKPVTTSSCRAASSVGKREIVSGRMSTAY